MSDSEQNFGKLSAIVDEIKPDIILLNSFFEYKFTVSLLFVSILKDIPVLLAPRGEICPNAFKLNGYKKKPYLFALRSFLRKKNVFFLSTSDEETASIKQLIGTDRIFQIENVPTIPCIQHNSRYKYPGKLKCVFISRISRKKNLLFALHFLQKVNGDVEFDIYGPKDEAYWDECLVAIKGLPKNIHVCYKGVLNREDVHSTFTDYDLLLFPTLSENYGHVIVESLVSGCPILISDQTPWKELELYHAGYSFSLENMDVFSDAVQEYVDMDNDDFIKCVNGCKAYVNDKLDIEKLKKMYLTAFTSIIQKTVK